MGVAGASTSSVTSALATLAGAVATCPPGAANTDGSVNWDKAAVHDVAVPKPTSDPQQVGMWWRSLTTQEQEYLLEKHPESLGNLDGIPVGVRDAANRPLIDARIRSLKTGINDKYPDGEPDKSITVYGMNGPMRSGNPEWKKWKGMQDELQGVATVRTRITADSSPAYYVIGFQPEKGNGRAIVSRGNPDFADHVSTYVPGTFAKYSSMDNDISRSDKMRTSAMRYTRGEVATVTWVGYDAPQSIPVQAGQMKYADHAAPLLRSFQSGLRETHQGDTASHNTVLGHSYGTTVVGDAAKGSLDADDVVMVASPGAGVGHGWNNSGTVKDLHLDGSSTGHVYATRSDSDPIKFSTDTHLGADPFEDHFGARQFGADPEGGHSDYRDSFENPSMTGMGKVIAGDGNQVVRPTSKQKPVPTPLDLDPYLAP